jgi:hypothetical protein
VRTKTDGCGCWKARDSSTTKVSIFLYSALICVSTAAAQERIPVSVNHSGRDRVGVRLSFELKETLARSARYSAGTDGDFTSAVISLVSIGISNYPGTNDADALSSAVSVQFRATWKCGNGVMQPDMTHAVHLVGADQAAAVARDILSRYAEWLESEGTEACFTLKGW